MVPDIEWGKNIRVVLDIGCTDSSFVASLLDKDVLTISLGLKDDLIDLAQVALERGFPAIVSPFGSRRLPFPSAVFDAIHCGGCGNAWHSNGLYLLLSVSSSYFIVIFLPLLTLNALPCFGSPFLFFFLFFLCS